MNDTLLTAAWIAPMTGPLLRDGGVVFREGRIAAVGSVRLLRQSYPAAQLHEAGDAVVLPGLINAHTHLELSGLQRGDPPVRFVDWIIDLMNRAMNPGTTIDSTTAVRIGIEQCLRFGVTSIGDITSQPAVSRGELAGSALSGVSFGEVRAMAQRRGFLEARLLSAVDSDPMLAGPTQATAMSLGISPHAPYSIEFGGYERCVSAARELGLPLATHLAETPDEAIFLADHTGPFKELWDHLGAWDSQVPRFVGGPIRFAKAIGLLDFPALLAHVNYCDNAEMDLLANGQASVVYCPRTHAFFGHPPHRWREMLSRGINVTIGTDSCASSPDLNVVDDLRLLHRLALDVDAMDLWHMVTTRGAAALGIPDIGSLSQGKIANAVVFQTQTQDPLREILENSTLPAQVWSGGNLISVAK